MFLTGFADEASSKLELQIKATKELGWSHIESRRIDDSDLASIDDAGFDKVCGLLEDNNIKINCFGSRIANWSSQITDPFEQTTNQIKNCIPRMQKLGCNMVRIMSYAVLKDNDPEDQMEEERFRRVREIKKMFDDSGIIPVHENCMNYGGMGWNYTLRLIENVPGLRLVFDTGNPVFTDDRSKKPPYPKQSAWEFYQKVKDHIEYIHIKDGIWNKEEEKTTYTYAGDGQGNVKEIVADLLKTNYDGGISMEPHIGTVYHDTENVSDDEKKYKAYVEYGKRFMKLLEDVKAGATV